MAEEKETTMEKYTFGSDELKAKTKAPVFEVEGRILVKFEDKKPFVVEVQTNYDIFSRETKYGLKYYVPVIVKKQEFYWQCSSNTLDTLQDNAEHTNKFNVMLNVADKIYSIVPLIEEEE
jgi:hypothetical protein